MLALLISAGCSPTTSADPETSSAGGMIPGTYLGTGEGRNGAIVVEVTVSENAIEAVNVISEKGNAEYGNRSGRNVSGIDRCQSNYQSRQHFRGDHQFCCDEECR